jgi:DNA polymerase-3 subunit beta
MKITINRPGFLQACQQSLGIVDAKSPKPILANIRINCEGGSVSVYASNADSSIEISIGSANVDEPGVMLAPCQKITEILREVGDDEVSISSESSGNYVRGASSEFMLPYENPSDYPEKQSIESSSKFTMKALVLSSMIKRVSFATSDVEHSRFGATTGVLFDLRQEGKLTLVGTDGRRMAVVTGPANKPAMTDELVVPEKVLRSLVRELGEFDGEVEVRWNKQSVGFRTERAEFCSIQVEGKFPRWEQVLPKNTRFAMRVKAQELTSVVRQASLLTDQETKRINLKVEDKKLSINTATHVGKSHVELELTESDKMSVAVDHHFLLDFLKTVPGDTTLKVDVGDQNLLVFTSEEEGDLSHRYVLVPLVMPGAKP